MENTTKIIVSAVTHIGAACTVNDDRVYANGRFFHPSVADYAQISIEVYDEKCLFAVSDGMEDENSGISITNELKKFQQKVQSSSKDIHVKLDELVQYVEQSSNLMHSVSLGDNDYRDRKTAFAGILINDGSIAAVNFGSCRIYKLEGDTFKLLVNDYKRAERLLKMGIISNEQAEMLSGQRKSSMEDGRSTVKKSDVSSLKEGIVYLICSSGLTDAVNEDIIYDIIASNSDPDEAASVLVAEAVKNEGGDNITAMVIKIEQTGSSGDQPAVHRSSYTGNIKRGKVNARLGKLSVPVRRRAPDFKRLVPVVVLALLAAAVLFGAYSLWAKLRNPEARGVPGRDNTNTTTTEASSSPSDVDETEDIIETGDVTTEGAINAGVGETTAEGGNGSDLVGPNGTEYVVKPGDMLMKISKKFYGDENKYTLIMEANNITDADKIVVGQKLKIPPLK